MANNVMGYEEEIIGSDDNIVEDEYRGGSQEPFDPTQIRMTRQSLTIDLLISRLKYGEIDLYPDFQREPNLWTNVDQSRLIESLLLRIPIPAFYFDATNDEKWLVIDGVQRLTALARFVMDEEILKERYSNFEPLKLEYLEFLTNLNDSTFKALERSSQRRLLETNVTVYTIDSGTPDKVTYNIFKRINTGGLPLTAQEIRNASYPGPATKFLRELADSKAFSKATQDKLQNSRGEDQECILRFVAFSLRSEKKNKEDKKQGFDQFLQDFSKSLNKYQKQGFDQFLLDTMDRMNKMSQNDLEKLKKTFEKAMNAAHNIFGKVAFRRMHYGAFSGIIIRSLFEVWSVNFGQLSDSDISKLIEKKEYLIHEFRKLFTNTSLEKSFLHAILVESQKVEMVEFRFKKVRQLIEEVLANQDPWNNIEENYPIGSTVKGKVVRFYRSGVFVELEKGLEGLIQVSELSWTKGYPNPVDFFEQGDEVDVVVLEILREEKELLLSYKQTKPNPWEKYKVDSVVRGKIVNIVTYGAFAELEENVHGLIHVSELAAKSTINPRDVVAVGDQLYLKVLSVDVNKSRISLSLKAMLSEKQPGRKPRQLSHPPRH